MTSTGAALVAQGVRDGANNCRMYNRGRVLSSTVQVDGRVTALQLTTPPSSEPAKLIGGTDRGCLYSLTLSYNGSEPAAKKLLQESHYSPITAVSYPPDVYGSDAAGASSVFATCGEDGSVRVWDASEYSVSAKAVCQTQKTGAPTCLAFSGEVMFTGWQDGKIRAHEAEEGQPLWEIPECHRGGLSALRLSHNLKFLVSGGEEGDVRVWEIRTRDMFLHLKQHTTTITSLEIFSDDSHVLSASRDRNIYVWDLHSRTCTYSLKQRRENTRLLPLATPPAHP